MPADFQGDLIICEPVGRLIRRAKVTNDQGRIVLSNAYDQQEFIAATDPNFRPVNSATGPDGCLYLVDMYRGIIQEGNWVREGSYLREIVEEYELDKNIGLGRIYRVEHQLTQRGSQPRMLDETPAELVAHLSHPNGWWRSESQKLIILHGDPRVVSALRELAENGDSALGRLHAFWTLEGLAAIDVKLLARGLQDPDGRVRAAAMRISEPFLKIDRSLDAAINRLTRDVDPDVAIQVLLSTSYADHPEAAAIAKYIQEAHGDNLAVSKIADQLRANREAILAERRKIEELRRRNKLLAESVVRGKQIYTTLCDKCHGSDGKGAPSPDNKGLKLAPPLAGSTRVRGHRDRLTRILLHGLMGPVDEKTYAGALMLPMGANDDQWIADVATYVRNSWGNRSAMIEASDVKRIRADSIDHEGPWMLAQLSAFDVLSLEDRVNWKLSASHGLDKVGSAIDGQSGSRWDTGRVQNPGMWFKVELPEPMRVLSLVLDTRGSNDDYPRGYLVHVSNDGKDWGEVVAKGRGSSPIEELELSIEDPCRFIRITQTGKSPNKYWSIHELSIKGVSADADLFGAISLSNKLGEEAAHDLAVQARNTGDAVRGAALFYQQSLSCSKCHDPKSGERLGPDLASRREGVTDDFLVESVLQPSKSIRKGFETMMVQTEDGLVVSGFHVRDEDEKIVLREPAGGKEIELYKDDLLGTKLSELSAMPPGLVNLLADRQQFLDLVRFLMEINQGGQQRLDELK